MCSDFKCKSYKKLLGLNVRFYVPDYPKVKISFGLDQVIGKGRSYFTNAFRGFEETEPVS